MNSKSKMKALRPLIALGLIHFCLLTHIRAESTEWRPARTWVFAVGVLQFDDSKVTTYPDKGRVDAEMIEVLQRRGVPADHILFIKNGEATKANIVHKFGPFLQRTAPGDTLLFYYAGHGGRDYTDPARTCTFLTWDTKSNWTVASVFDTVQQNFHGSQVIYAADCCHSGSLVDEARRHPGRSAALASAHVASTSTGNWTFTQCLVEMFKGDPLMDANGDGQVTFTEAARFTEGEMAFLEGQHADFTCTGGFPANLTMSHSTGTHTTHMGEHVEGEFQGKWWKAEVLAEKDGQYYVTWPGWDKSYNEWLPASRIRTVQTKTLPVGTPVQAEWRTQWFDGRVIKTEMGLHLIHYDGFSAGDDEWMGIGRLREKAAR